MDNRYLFVKINGFKSQLFKQETGVPQGSVLGPLLFHIYIDDIVEVINANSLLFADDLKLYNIIDSLQDSPRLQKCLDAVFVWCTRNYLMLNESKCYVMIFAKKETPIIFSYILDNIILTKPEVIRDLGVVFDPKLSFNFHIESF